MTRRLNEHIERELFNKDERDFPNLLQTEVNKVKEKKPFKKSTLISSPVIEEESKPVKKKRPYYRKKYNKPKLFEIVTPEPVNNYWFIKGLLVGSVLTAIICHIIYSI